MVLLTWVLLFKILRGALKFLWELQDPILKKPKSFLRDHSNSWAHCQAKLFMKLFFIYLRISS